MNKADIINKVHEELGITKADAERAVETVFGSISKALVDRVQVSVAGFGIFEAGHVKARESRNPRTGEPVQVPAHYKAKFRAAKALKESVK